MNRSNEVALFVTPAAAQRACDRAMQRRDIFRATVHKRMSRGEMKGYWVCLKGTDGTLTQMSEDYAEVLMPCHV